MVSFSACTRTHTVTTTTIPFLHTIFFFFHGIGSILFFFLLSYDCFDFLGLFSPICFGRNALVASSLVVGRSIFICFVLVDLASDDGSDWRDLRRQIVLIHSSKHTEMLVLFFLAVDFSTLRHKQTHTRTRCRTFPPALRLSFSRKTFSLSRARQNPLFLCVNPSSSSSCSGSASNLHTSVVGCSGAVQVSGLAGASLAAAAAAAAAVSREWSSVKWTEPSELSKKRAQTHTRSATRRRDPEQSPARRWTSSSSSSARSLPSKSR